MKQLPLALPIAPRFGEEDFLVSKSNAGAFGIIETWPYWPGGMLLLVGPAASGKTHLATIWATRSEALVLDAAMLSSTSLGERLQGTGAIVVENIDRPGCEEAALFHLINMVAEQNGSLLMTSGLPAGSLALKTPDLVSRLRRMPAAQIALPDETLVRALLVKHFVDRQIEVDASLIAFLALRLERRFDAISEAVAKLDEAALARQRRLTRVLAAEVLDFDTSP